MIIETMSWILSMFILTFNRKPETVNYLDYPLTRFVSPKHYNLDVKLKYNLLLNNLNPKR